MSANASIASIASSPRSLAFSSLVPSLIVLISSCAMAEPLDPAEISALLHEDRVFNPPAAFRDRANVRDTSSYDEADRDFEGFWAKFAGELEWSRKWEKVLDWNPPNAKWFVGGTLNASVNCVDR